jgi:hypothetical protein
MLDPIAVSVDKMFDLIQVGKFTREVQSSVVSCGADIPVRVGSESTAGKRTGVSAPHETNTEVMVLAATVRRVWLANDQ